MSKPYDSVFKDLLERDPRGWVELALGPVSGTATLVDSDISTVSGAADKVVRLEEPEPHLVHFEGFAAWDATILARSMNYNGAHHRRHLLPGNPPQRVAQLFRGIPGMKESSTYQLILEEGQIKEARRALLLVGTSRLGAPDSANRSSIESEESLAQIEEWLGQVGRAESWSELPGLQQP